MDESSLFLSRKQHEVIAELSLMVMSSTSILDIQSFLLDKLVDNMESPYVIIGRRLNETNQVLLHTKRSNILYTKVLNVDTDLDTETAESRALESKQTIFENDLVKAKLKAPSYLTEEIINNVCCVIVVPLKTDQKNMGFISVYDRHQHIFNKNDADFLQTVAQLVSVAMDRLETETQLLRYKERLDLAQVSNNTGVFEWNLTSDMIWWSRGEEQLFKVPEGTFEEDYLDRSSFPYWKERVHPADKERVSQDIRETMHNKQQDYENEFRLIYPGGLVRWIKSVARIYYDTNKQPVRMLGVNYDITEQQKQEERKDAFISMASHELKTPLTSIKAFNQMILRKVEAGNIPKDELEVYLGKIDLQINKLALLVNELLDVTRIKQGKLLYSFQKFDLTVLMEEIVETISQSYPSHQLNIVAPSHLFIEGDPNRIEQTIINVLVNAIKYSPRGDQIEIHISKDDNLATISVTDHGIGIPKHVQQKIGQRFFRVEGRDEEKFPGMGIGLYISYQIVEHHNGKIWFESKEGRGTTFHISLPLSHIDEN